jgi:hypothetical protein
LTEASLDNLATWRLEPAARQQKIQITYSYVHDLSVPEGKTQPEFVLPKKVIIRASPNVP